MKTSNKQIHKYDFVFYELFLPFEKIIQRRNEDYFAIINILQDMALHELRGLPFIFDRKV